MVTVRLQIRGHVQGVGFRYAMRAEALERRVRGWVRNRRDGSVEAVVQGDRQAVDAILAWARTGPPGARVAEVVAAPAAGEEDRPYSAFDWLPSA